MARGPAEGRGAVVVAEPLARDAFAPFGEVIGAGPGPGRETNQGTAARFDRLAALESTRAGARPNLAVFRCAPRALPLALTVIERHPHSTQAFVPMACARWLICVVPAAPDGSPNLSGLRAFVCGSGQGVNLKRGQWHHPIVGLDRPAEFVMLAWEDGTSADCEELSLPAPITILERFAGR